MGRPKGSLNKKHKKPVMFKKKRGRPRKVVEEVILPPEPPSIIKKSKFYGYCPKCKFMITKKDLASKFIFECPGCGKRARISKLKKNLESENKALTKKEYLENTLNAQHIDMLPLNDHIIDPKDLKVQDT